MCGGCGRRVCFRTRCLRAVYSAAAAARGWRCGLNGARRLPGRMCVGGLGSGLNRARCTCVHWCVAPKGRAGRCVSCVCASARSARRLAGLWGARRRRLPGLAIPRAPTAQRTRDGWRCGTNGNVGVCMRSVKPDPCRAGQLDGRDARVLKAPPQAYAIGGGREGGGVAKTLGAGGRAAGAWASQLPLARISGGLGTRGTKDSSPGHCQRACKGASPRAPTFEGRCASERG